MISSPSNNITLKQIRIFLTAAKCENFSLAAKQMHITQPLVSQSIAQLEQELGYLVFDRDKSRVKLNAAGTILYAKWRSLLSLLDRSIEQGRKASQTYKPRFTIAVPIRTDNRSYFFPVIPLFSTLHPGIQVKVDQMDVLPAIRAVASESVDLGFTVYPERIQFRGQPIEWEIIGTCSTYIEVPPSSRFYNAESVRVAELVNSPVVLIDDDGSSGYTAAILGLFQEHGLALSSPLYVSTTAALESASALGDGIVIATDINPPTPGTRNRRVLVSDAPNGIIAFWRSGTLNPIVREFLSLVRTHLSTINRSL